MLKEDCFEEKYFELQAELAALFIDDNLYLKKQETYKL